MANITYSFSKVGKKSHKYDLIFEYVHANKEKTFTRDQLLVESKYISPTYYLSLTQRKVFGGYLSTLFNALNSNGIIIYDRKIKRWKAGPLFDSCYEQITR